MTMTKVRVHDAVWCKQTHLSDVLFNIKIVQRNLEKKIRGSIDMRPEFSIPVSMLLVKSKPSKLG
jgi:hypothetical protein